MNLHAGERGGERERWERWEGREGEVDRRERGRERE